MRALLAAFGTRGDLQPMFALARALGRAGHEALVVGPPNFALEAGVLGVNFQACGHDWQQMLHANADVGANPVGVIRFMRERSRTETHAHFDALLPLAREAEVLLCAGLCFVGPTVAQLAGIPYRYLAYSPQLLPSAHHPPPLSSVCDWPRPINRLLWKATCAVLDSLIGSALNERRGEFGLGAVRDVVGHRMAPDVTLLATDPEIAPAPPDVRLAEPELGSLRLDDERPLPEEVERFLSAGPAPVYIGFGSMPDPKPERTGREIAHALRTVGARAVVASGWAKLAAIDLGSRGLMIGEVPHGKLFPRLAAAVHHGGAGTTATALHAGIPQLIVPQTYDQFDWARRVHRLALGPAPVARFRLNGVRFAAALQALLLHPSHREVAQALAVRVRVRDGLHAAVGALERAAGVRRGAAASDRSPPTLGPPGTPNPPAARSRKIGA